MEARRPFRRLGEVLKFGVGHLLEEHLVHVLVVVAIDTVAAHVEHQLTRRIESASRRARPARLPSPSGAAAPANSVKFCMTAGAAARA